jgi:hypothetical protein
MVTSLLCVCDLVMVLQYTGLFLLSSFIYFCLFIVFFTSGVLHLYDAQSPLESDSARGTSDEGAPTKELLAVPLLHPKGTSVLLLGHYGSHGE